MKNKRRINLKKQINKSFDINQKEKDNISFGNNKGEELNNLTLQDEEQKRNTNVMETVNKDIDAFLNEFSEIFNEKITSNLLDELKDILSDKNKELTTLSRSYAIQIKEQEFKLLDTKDQKFKKKLGTTIYNLTQKEKVEKENIRKKYEVKIKEIKEKFKKEVENA